MGERTGLSECELENVRKTLYAELSRLTEEYDALSSEYAVEKASTVSLTVSEVRFFLNQLKNGMADDISYRRMLINIFVNAVYLYDDKITIYFNSGDNPVTVDDGLISSVEKTEEFVYRPACSTILAR